MTAETIQQLIDKIDYDCCSNECCGHPELEEGREQVRQAVAELEQRLKVAEHMVTELQKDNTRLVESRRAAVAELYNGIQGELKRLQEAFVAHKAELAKVEKERQLLADQLYNSEQANLRLNAELAAKEPR